MKKKFLFMTMLFISVMAFAKEMTFQWVSTCGTTHYTTFSGNWSNDQMSSYIASLNEVECNVRPDVNMNY